MADEEDAPRQVVYDLEEALDLLAALEDARETMVDTGHLSGVIVLQTQIRVLNRKLGFDDTDGGPNGR